MCMSEERSVQEEAGIEDGGREQEKREFQVDLANEGFLPSLPVYTFI